MDIFTKGVPVNLDDVPNGHCFTFEAGLGGAIGVKIAYPQSPTSRVLVLTRKPGQPPSLQSRQESEPKIVYKQPTVAILTGLAPSRLRSGIANPRPGQIMQLKDDVYVAFIDEHNDPSSVSLKTGLINLNPINGPAAVFETWQIAFHGGKEPEIMFVYEPGGVPQAT